MPPCLIDSRKGSAMEIPPTQKPHQIQWKFWAHDSANEVIWIDFISLALQEKFQDLLEVKKTGRYSDAGALH